MEAKRKHHRHGPSRRLLDQVRDVIRRRHYSIRTEEAYVSWIRRYILFHGKRRPCEMGERELEAFLTFFAVERRVSASTQNQALNAIVFLYRHVLKRELDWVDDVTRAKRGARLPVVFTREEAAAALSRLDGTVWTMASLLYGSGLRLMECVRLRVKDVDFKSREIVVREGKGGKDRVTMLPDRVSGPLADHLRRVRVIHAQDLSEGFGDVYLPYALKRKYPSAGREWGWQYALPASKRSIDPRSGLERRHHIDPSVLQRAVKQAVRDAKVHKPASCHTFRQAFATCLLENGYDIRTVQELLGHKDVHTTMIYTHVLNRGGRGVLSPVDFALPVPMAKASEGARATNEERGNTST